MSETEKKILKAAEAVFTEKGYAKTRLQEIADKAGIQNPHLHYYFRTKEKLYQKVLEKQLTRLLKPLHYFYKSTLSPWEALDKFIQEVWMYYKKNPKLFRRTLSASEDFKQELRELSLGSEEPPFFMQLKQMDLLPENVAPKILFLQIITLTYFPPLAENIFQNTDKDELMDNYYIQLPTVFRKLLQK